MINKSNIVNKRNILFTLITLFMCSLFFMMYIIFKNNDVFSYEEKLNLNLENINCEKIYIPVKKIYYSESLIASCLYFGKSVIIDSYSVEIIDDTIFYISHNMKTNITEIYTDDPNIVKYVKDVNNIKNFKNIIIENTKKILILTDLKFKEKNEKMRKKEKEIQETEYKLLEIKKLQ